MSVIKSETKIICDICGKDVTYEINRYYFRELFGNGIFKKHMCYECFKELRNVVREKRKVGGRE